MEIAKACKAFANSILFIGILGSFCIIGVTENFGLLILSGLSSYSLYLFFYGLGEIIDKLAEITENTSTNRKKTKIYTRSNRNAKQNIIDIHRKTNKNDKEHKLQNFF